MTYNFHQIMIINHDFEKLVALEHVRWTRQKWTPAIIIMGDIWLTSFCTPEFRWSAELLRHTALHTGGVDRVKLWTPEDIKAFTDAHPAIFHGGSRGFGYFAWKPFVITETLKLLNDDDWLVYCDSAIMFEAGVRDYLQRNGLLQEEAVLFTLGEARTKGYSNGDWTKPAVVEYMNVHPDVAREHQLNAGICMFRKTRQTEAFMQAWLRVCLEPGMVDDSGPPAPREHRHDQSILSLMSAQALRTWSSFPPGVGYKPRMLVDCTQYGVDDEDHDALAIRTLVDHHRRKYPPMATTTVITSSLGRSELRQCVQSVQAQELPCVEHLIVADGPRAREAVRQVARDFEYKHPIHVIELPYNVGHSGYNGHRVFGSMPYLCESDYISLLDDDNWLDPEHLLDMMRVVNKQSLDGSFSLRTIHDKDGTYLRDDACESLGNFTPSILAPDDWFCDTSTMLVGRDLAIQLAPLWNSRFRSGGLEADRAFSRAFLKHNVVGVPRHSLHYRLGGGEGSVTQDFFRRGNQVRRLDFHRPIIYLFHFKPTATKRALEVLWDDSRSYAYDEWQMSLCKGLRDEYNLLDGYVCQDAIPPGSTVLCHLCNPGDMPLHTIFSRLDLRRICYTLESGNVRHAAQWDRVFLEKYFDVLLTYWHPKLSDPTTKTVPCLHNTHHLDLSNPHDREAGLRDNLGGLSRSVCMVLENRGTQGEYKIGGLKLHAQDHLRAHYVKDLRNATVFGVHWDEADLGPGVTVGHSLHRDHDPRSSVDHMQKHTFALIVENCDARGYVSEKILASFSAGCIPLYYDAGNNDDFTAIPRDMYIDISGILTSTALQEHLDRLTDEDIESMRQSIYAKREAVLGRRSIQAYASAVEEAVALL